MINNIIACTTPSSQANDALCEGIRVALALNAPIITRCKCLTASRFLYRLRLGRHTKRGEVQHLITRQIGSDCYGSHFYCEHFFDFFRHTPKQQDRLLGLCHFAFNCRQPAWQILPTTLLSEFHLKKQGPSKFFS